jgi:hypothetical protein
VNDSTHPLIPLDGLTYHVELLRQVKHPPSYPRLVIIAYQPNPQASRILEICIRTIQRHTFEPHELWVIDNDSPADNTSWLREMPGINIAFNHTFPIPPRQRRLPWNHIKSFQRQQRWGSYANAIGLELAVRMIEPESHFLVTLHMDTAPCQVGWLSFLQSKLNDRVRAAGVHLQRGRVPEGVLHVLGLILDFQLFRQLKLDFFPCLPQLDVGDRVTIGLRQAGFDVAACRDTLNQPELINLIPASSPCKELKVFRALDDENHVIFLHLGRGVRKTTGEHSHGVTPNEWINFAYINLLT